jgi:hypothetical protein
MAVKRYYKKKKEGMLRKKKVTSKYWLEKVYCIIHEKHNDERLMKK